ncbi:glycosyltransferase [Cellulomonas sp. JZ18]|nr:glycosyltransferase [Cellulomonas sp. JZ18]
MAATAPLAVALTVEQCWQPVPGGSGTYIAELARALRGVPDVAPVGLAARHDAADVPAVPPGLPVRHATLPRALLYEAWNRTRRPRAEATVDVEVVHATTWAVPGTRRPLVVTVHDLAFLREPAHFTRRGNAFFRRALRVVRDEAARVVVPSRVTADECVAEGIEESRLVVVPHGVRAAVVDGEARAAWRAGTGVTGPYVLWCGTLEPRKNVPALVHAFARARAAGELADRTLVLVGPAGWGTAGAEVERALASLPPGAVRLLGRLGDADLQVAYAEAEAFAFPSLREGFGMPVLEAMAHGVPVVTSRASAMAEVAGGLAELVEPTDVDALAAGLVRACATPAPVRERIRAHAAACTWEASAQAHAAVYRSVRP